jgi:hypothetical protein
MSSDALVLAFTHTSKLPLKKKYILFKKNTWGNGGLPPPLRGSLAILKRDCIFITAIKRYYSIAIKYNTTARPAKVRI